MYICLYIYIISFLHVSFLQTGIPNPQLPTGFDATMPRSHLGRLSGVRGLTEGGGTPDPAAGLAEGMWRIPKGVEVEEVMLNQLKTGCWFQILFIFITTWGRFPFWLIFFRWVWNHQLEKVREVFIRNMKIAKHMWLLGEIFVKTNWLFITVTVGGFVASVDSMWELSKRSLKGVSFA